MSLLGGFLSKLRAVRRGSGRSSRRFTVLTPARIWPDLGGGAWISCILDNVSGGGACIQGRFDMSRGDRAQLRLNLGYGREIGMRVRVVHTKVTAPRARSTYGVRFTDIAYADCQTLTTFLASRESTGGVEPDFIPNRRLISP